MHLTSRAIGQRRCRNSLAGVRVSVLRTAADLHLLRQPRATRRRLYVVLEIGGVPSAQLLRWESRLNSHLRECGCALGAKFSAAALLASIVWQFVHHAWGLSHWPAFLLRTAVVVFAAGGLGKLLGLSFAELGIRRISSRLMTFVEGLPRGRGEHVDLHKVGG
jgi:hypothetical protein